ncbi:MAG: TlpA family protein disulfide reductase [Deltaproteobacteria bacterium]|nr:TlpA family protein disulfide reductase [Deltaproteobacteria bacterium]MBW2420691.1 TlpA family protein disulfide reductase [Deltaproteobacteria bacterium]
MPEPASPESQEEAQQEESARFAQPASPILRVVAAAAVVAIGLALILLGDDVPEAVGRGGPAPEFVLPLLDAGREIRLSDHRGQVVLVNFWATWCKPCEDEMPAMERLYRRLGPRGFEMLAVSVDEDPDAVRGFKEKMGITFPLLLDPSQSVARAYQTMGFPESLLVDREGNVVERYVGPREWDHPAYVERIEGLLAGGAGAPTQP